MRRINVVLWGTIGPFHLYYIYMMLQLTNYCRIWTTDMRVKVLV